MSKFILCLFLLLSLYNCEKVFEISDEDTNKHEFEVRKGEEFSLKFASNPTTGFSWHFLNEDEVNDSILFIKSEYVASPGQPLKGKGGHTFFYFKAIEVTNEAKQLEFTYSRGTNTNGLTKQIVKINVY